MFLWIGGECGTLVLPTTQDRLSAWDAAKAAMKTVTDETPATNGVVAEAPANDEEVLRAA